ncbi:dethiobiotin synthase [Flectobacillus roseus]|uniref:dethiobiotin synthase n=1 Tax=Flectobacillus roseus TaxID=502259 RepID=UPI0024B7B163|nr:dethiobiotin synthase [Flectobacillus roseus]MDI9870632.1 dethiobiotin synthase [Flectobacillus roseus]
MKKQFIVAGIGTEIGKTFISSVLVEALQADYWKPIQSGGLDFSDTHTVKSLVSIKNNTFFPEAYRLNEPLSPHAAAALDGITIELSKIQLPVTERNLIVELAGGLMVPLNDNDLVIDMVQQLNLPVILVSKNYLGSINHTLLSVEALKSRNIPVEGIIFNGISNASTESFILNYTKLKCLGRVPTQAEIDKPAVRKLADALENNWQ